ncbi:hypothetical protein EVAR_38084_1 [Eumeta japonica]|uniref:Uncharacterized protein n=1 Tax=Eumeta variegata TaxID=151549 RepID=A0A4C1W7H7_EUMVA|nr:hypothetical protein EVAR_38084_1 [Eumeta japonica]
MWCTTTYFYTLCVVFVTCKVLPAPGRNRNMGVLRDADLVETSGIRGQTQSEKVEDYEEVHDYIKMHEIGGVLNTKVESVNAPKGQEAKKVYGVKEKNNYRETSNFSVGEITQNSILENNKAIERLLETPEKFQQNVLKKLSSINVSDGNAKVRMKRLTAILPMGCPAGMKPSLFGCFR